jgi:hypothetical protein
VQHGLGLGGGTRARCGSGRRPRTQHKNKQTKSRTYTTVRKQPPPCLLRKALQRARAHACLAPRGCGRAPRTCERKLLRSGSPSLPRFAPRAGLSRPRSPCGNCRPSVAGGTARDGLICTFEYGNTNTRKLKSAHSSSSNRRVLRLAFVHCACVCYLLLIFCTLWQARERERALF